MLETLAPDTRLGDRYVLKGQIAREDGVRVWLADDVVLDRVVVIRTLDPGSDDPGRAERFEQAARDAARLSHPNVLRIFDVGIDAGTRYVVTEHLDGEPLEALIAREGSLEPARASAITTEVLIAFEAARTEGVTHGHIGTSDVFVGVGPVKVAGFATADAIDDRGPRDDVRSAGELLYEMVTGRSATNGNDRPARSINPRVPRDLESVIERALSDGDGFAGPQDMRGSLSRLRFATVQMPVDEIHRRPNWFRSWMLVPLVLVILTIGVIASGLALGKLEIGGPLGVRAAPEPTTSPTAEAQHSTPPVRDLTGLTATAVDPFGDGVEDSDQAALAVDGNRTTSWHTEDYFVGQMGKPGVGLLIDLGTRATVTKFRLTTSDPGFDFEVRIGDDPDALVRANGERFEARSVTRGRIRPASGRYAMVWISSVVPLADGTHRATIEEFTVSGYE